MSCTFKDESSRCFFCKEHCERKEKEVQDCKYYKRQYPKVKEEYEARFKKALDSAIEKRNLLNFCDLEEEAKAFVPDMSISIYENVCKAIEIFPTLSFSYREKNKVDKSMLEGDITKNIASGLYTHHNVVITEKYKKDNSVVGYINNEKYRIYFNDDIDHVLWTIEEGVGSPQKSKMYQYFFNRKIELKG